MDVILYKKIQDYRKDAATMCYLQAASEASQDWALEMAYDGKVGLMVQYELGDDGSTVTWSSIETWTDLYDNATALALLRADTDVDAMFADYDPYPVYGIALV